MFVLLHDIAKLQKEYEKLRNSGHITKKMICDLCIPFRDKYELTDLETLRIARDEMSIAEIDTLFNNEKIKPFPYETEDECKRKYCPPIRDYIHCERFGNSDGMDGTCINCSYNEPFQWQMCQDEERVQDFIRRNKCTREEAINKVKEVKERSK